MNITALHSGTVLIYRRHSLLYSTKEVAGTEEPKSTSVSRDGIIAVGIVFGIFAAAVGTFVTYLIYREKKGKPLFSPQVSWFLLGSGIFS